MSTDTDEERLLWIGMSPRKIAALVIVGVCGVGLGSLAVANYTQMIAFREVRAAEHRELAALAATVKRLRSAFVELRAESIGLRERIQNKTRDRAPAGPGGSTQFPQLQRLSEISPVGLSLLGPLEISQARHRPARPRKVNWLVQLDSPTPTTVSPGYQLNIALGDASFTRVATSQWSAEPLSDDADEPTAATLGVAFLDRAAASIDGNEATWPSKLRVSAAEAEATLNLYGVAFGGEGRESFGASVFGLPAGGLGARPSPSLQYQYGCGLERQCFKSRYKVFGLPSSVVNTGFGYYYASEFYNGGGDDYADNEQMTLLYPSGSFSYLYSRQ